MNIFKSWLVALALLLPFAYPNNAFGHPPCQQKQYVWIVKYAGDPVARFNSLEAAERWCWEQIRKGCKERWLFEIQRKLK